MKNHANGMLTEFIMKHRSPLCRETDPLSMFAVNIDQTTALALFALRDRNCLQLYVEGDGESWTLSLLDFDAQSRVEDLVFTYNQYNIKGYIDKKKATPGGEIVSGLTAGKENAAVIDAVGTQWPWIKDRCQSLAGIALSLLEEIFEKENANISLSDFGYVHFGE